jgi:hypothetical protein
MAKTTKINRLSKVLIALSTLFIVFVFSCNSASSGGDKKDTTATPTDTSMKMGDSSKSKMGKDSTKMSTDTSSRGGQTPPTKP